MNQKSPRVNGFVTILLLYLLNYPRANTLRREIFLCKRKIPRHFLFSFWVPPIHFVVQPCLTDDKPSNCTRGKVSNHLWSTRTSICYSRLPLVCGIANHYLMLNGTEWCAFWLPCGKLHVTLEKRYRARNVIHRFTCRLMVETKCLYWSTRKNLFRKFNTDGTNKWIFFL